MTMKNLTLQISSATHYTHTKIYEEVFHAIPSDNVRKFATLKKYTADEAVLICLVASIPR
jgi:hypothetical protein